MIIRIHNKQIIGIVLLLIFTLNSCVKAPREEEPVKSKEPEIVIPQSPGEATTLLTDLLKYYQINYPTNPIQQVKVLLENGADPNIKFSFFSLDGVSEIQDSPLFIRVRTRLSIENDITPIFSAVRGDDIELLQLLINAGAEINYQETTYGMTPLLYSTYYMDRVPMARALLEAGADPSIPANDGYMMFGVTPLMAAVFNQNVEMINLLLEYGADPNQAGSDNGAAELNFGMTPLIIAVAYRNMEVIEALIAGGADVNKPCSDNGKTALADGSTLLVLIAFDNDDEIIKKLLDAGADPNIPRSSNGLSPFSDGSAPLVISTGHENSDKSVHLLVEAGADPSHMNDLGYNALFVAAELGRFDYCDYFLEHGADPTLVNPHTSQTAADYARSKGQEEMADYLEDIIETWNPK